MEIYDVSINIDNMAAPMGVNPDPHPHTGAKPVGDPCDITISEMRGPSFRIRIG
jgi:hypothetical protein